MSESTPPPAAGLSPAQQALIGFFVLVGLGYAGWLGYRQLQTPMPETKAPPPPTVAEAAEAYSRKTKGAPLSGPLADLLKEAESKARPTKAGYPLLGKPAPDFTLIEALGQKVALKELLAKGPVVLVFYYGYHCDHCVSQLFGLNEDLKYFQEFGASVVAISADPAEETLAKYQKFGRFRFPVLSDPGNAVAQQYGVFAPRSKDLAEFLWHGTFVISQDGKIVWADWGDEPFADNKTLLHELAKLKSK